MTWGTSINGNSIEAVNVYTAGGNMCNTSIPITVLTEVSPTNEATNEQLESDPFTMWVNMAGSFSQYNL